MSKLLPRSTPAKEGVAAKSITKILTELKKEKLEFHSIMIARNGKVIAEGWRKPYSPTLTHSLFSLSKSFTSTAIGFAVEEGLISLDDKVVSFFEDKLSGNPCENMNKMTVRNLLTMSSGHSIEPIITMRSLPFGVMKALGFDFAKFFMQSYVDLQPGERFVYNTLGTYMLSAIIQKVTSMTVFDYLTPRLFEPLSIENIWWEQCPLGINTGGYGLNLKTEDILKFGIMLLNDGVYNGKRIISEKWVREATSKHIDNYGEKDWGAGYGYQFWQCAHPNMFRGDGAFGQYCLVMRDEKIVIATTSGLNDMQRLMDVIRDNLLLGVKDEPFKDNTDDEKELMEALNELSMDFPKGDMAPDNFDSGSFLLGENELNIKEISFNFKDEPVFSMKIGEDEFNFPMGFKEFKECKTGVEKLDFYSPFVYDQVATAYGVEGNSVNIRLVYNTSPYVDDVKITLLEGNSISFSLKRNVGLYKAARAVTYGIRKI